MTKQLIAHAIVGDGMFGFKFFGETFETDNIQYWENRGYTAVPVYVDMDAELKEYVFY